MTFKTSIELLILAFFFLVVSCTSNTIDLTRADSQSITLSGNWLWIESSGGLGYHVVTPTAGTRVTDTYEPDGHYFRYRNDTLIDSKTFVIRKKYSIVSNDSLDAIVFEDSRPETLLLPGYSFIILKLTADSLCLGDNMYDGYSSLFVRFY
jgi:hypothetical protein